MFTMLTVIRKRAEVSTEEFRRFMELEYGPTYVALPQTREYIQYFLADAATDGADEPIDAIVKISFDSQDDMRQALQSPSYHRACELRKAYLRETSAGIHPAIVEHTATLL
ncbi:EthD domain-containing protein [Nonomuraea endophytica]|nr:EthD domain-containing protein [Nonomuraea endophytica]